jgi:hypothetical protein
METPPVSGDAVSKGSWTIFTQDEPEEDEPYVGPLMRSCGSNARGKGDTTEDEEIWYNRKLKRKLIFSDLPALPRVLKHVDDEFGRPVPGWYFGEWVNDKPSVWMYKREKASRSRVGERYSPPTPWMLSLSPEIPTALRKASPGEESVVSLGPEEDAVMMDIETQNLLEVAEIAASRLMSLSTGTVSLSVLETLDSGCITP